MIKSPLITQEQLNSLADIVSGKSNSPGLWPGVPLSVALREEKSQAVSMHSDEQSEESHDSPEGSE